MKKYYNFDTRFISLRDALRAYLHGIGVYYELSGNYSYYHFEILTDAAGVDRINNFLDNNTIWHKGV